VNSNDALTPEKARAMIADIDRELTNLPKPHPYEDWHYRDIPLCSEEVWQLLLGAIGAGEYVMLISTKHTQGDQVRWRGQFWISPKGLENLAAWAKARAQ
jgi:hypothetical protein